MASVENYHKMQSKIHNIMNSREGRKWIQEQATKNIRSAELASPRTNWRGPPDEESIAPPWDTKVIAKHMHSYRGSRSRLPLPTPREITQKEIYDKTYTRAKSKVKEWLNTAKNQYNKKPTPIYDELISKLEIMDKPYPYAAAPPEWGAGPWHTIPVEKRPLHNFICNKNNIELFNNYSKLLGNFSAPKMYGVYDPRIQNFCYAPHPPYLTSEQLESIGPGSINKEYLIAFYLNEKNNGKLEDNFLYNIKRQGLTKSFGGRKTRRRRNHKRKTRRSRK